MAPRVGIKWKLVDAALAHHVQGRITDVSGSRIPGAFAGTR